MTVEARFGTGAPDTRLRCTSPEDPDLVEMVDAVVSAVDTDRSWEVERVAAAFEPSSSVTGTRDQTRDSPHTERPTAQAG